MWGVNLTLPLACKEFLVSCKVWNIFSADLNHAGDRRKEILGTLKQRGIDIHVAPYSVWGANLTLLIRRAKIVLNLHYHEARTLETCRIMESTSLGALVSQEFPCMLYCRV